MNRSQGGDGTGTGLIGPGVHQVVIQSAGETKSKQGTPQIEVVFKALNNKVRYAWYNLLAFKKNASGDFLDKNGKVIKYSLQDEPAVIAKALAKRVPDAEATKKSQEIFQQFAGDTGITGDFELDDLVRREVLIGIKPFDEGNGRVDYTFALDLEEYAEKLLA